LFAATQASARSGPDCDPPGVDATALEAARAAIDAACACDAFPSHARYERCVDEVVHAEIAADRLRPQCRATVSKAAKRSSCSFRRDKVVCCEHTRDGRDVCTIKGARKCVSKGRRTRTPCPGISFCSAAACTDGACVTVTTTTTTTLPPCERGLLYAPEGNRLRRYDIDTIKRPPLAEDVLIPSASDSKTGRDINGQVCPFPDRSGRFITGEDTGQPHPPAGFGVFAADGTQVGKLTPTYQVRGQPDPFGCGFDAQGRLFTSDIGAAGIGAGSGQLVMWFPPFDHFPEGYPTSDTPSANFCKIATDIGTAGGIAVDEQGRVYVTSSGGFRVLRFSPPFPTSPDAAGGCGATDAVGSPMADTVNRETFLFGGRHVPTPSGIARARNGNWFVSSVLNGVIAEYTPEGQFVRRVLEPPATETPPEVSTGNPQGIAVDCEGDLYYADLNLVVVNDDIDAGPNGKVRWIHFDAAGNPAPPVIVKQNLAFPDSLGILPGNLGKR
jgi:hypothetical protein